MWRVLGSCFSKRESSKEMCGEYLEAASLREREERESSKEMCGEYLEAASLRERERRERE